MKRVLFDSDVLLDVLSQRQPFFAASAQAVNTAATKMIAGYVAAHSVTNVFYILRRSMGSEAARASLRRLFQHLEVANVDRAVIDAALSSSITDFEDAVVSEAARAAGLDIIVTRNISDFKLSEVPAIRPEDFLKRVFQSNP